MSERLISDLGGRSAGPINTCEHQPTMTERRIDAMMMLLRSNPRSFWLTDENRRAIESLTPKTYKESHYYERWVLAMRALLVEKRILTDVQIEERLGEIKLRYSKRQK